jgi:hypothetical protein
MTVFYIDTEETKANFADYLASHHNGMSYGTTIEFLDDNPKLAKKDHQAAMDEVMQCQVYGFSNERNGNKEPCMIVTDLNLHEKGYYNLCKKMADLDCLVIRAGIADNPPESIMVMHRAVMRFVNAQHNEEDPEQTIYTACNAGPGQPEESQWTAWFGSEDEFTAQNNCMIAYGKTETEAKQKLKKELWGI